MTMMPNLITVDYSFSSWRVSDTYGSCPFKSPGDQSSGYEAAPPEGHPRRIEHAYERGGALQYLAAWEVRRGYGRGRGEPTTGSEPFGRLGHQVLSQEPYRSGHRLFWIVANGSAHRGAPSTPRRSAIAGRCLLLHPPVHVSWLNQVELYFSIIHRKLLTPNDFAELEAIRVRLALYEELCNQYPRPLQWKFDRAQLAALLVKIEAREQARQQQLAAAQLDQLPGYAKAA